MVSFLQVPIFQNSVGDNCFRINYFYDNISLIVISQFLPILILISSTSGCYRRKAIWTGSPGTCALGLLHSLATGHALNSPSGFLPTLRTGALGHMCCGDSSSNLPVRHQIQAPRPRLESSKFLVACRKVDLLTLGLKATRARLELQ